MDLEFEINGSILKRVDTCENLVNKNYNLYNCVFRFEENSDWSGLDKFVIFRDGWENPYLIRLDGDSNVLNCLVPDCVLDGTYFKVSVFAGELLSTNNVSVYLIESGYSDGFYNVCNGKNKDVFVEIFDELDKNVDNIIYDEECKCFRLFNKDKLLKSVSLPFITQNDAEIICDRVLSEYVEDIPLATNINKGLMSSADKNKLDNLKVVALSGDYNDLNNIPNEFNPISHNHIMRDVTDYDENISFDLNNMLDYLYDEIRKE